MIVRIADNIISPLGTTSEANYQAVKAGKSELRRYEGKWNLPEPFVASLINRPSLDGEFVANHIGDGYTFFEKVVILSACKALADAKIDASSAKVLFILSTTKGNVHLLDANET